MNPKTKTSFVVLAAILGIAACIYLAITLLTNNSETSLEKALYIIDGDTFNTESGETIRLLCVDTPETGETGYEDAKAYLSALILGKDVLIERVGLDKYNRTLAWVYVGEDSVLVNKEIVEKGFGTVFEYRETNCSRTNWG